MNKLNYPHITISGPIDIENLIFGQGSLCLWPILGLKCSTAIYDNRISMLKVENINPETVDSMFEPNLNWELNKEEVCESIENYIHGNYTFIFNENIIDETEYSKVSESTILEVYNYLVNNKEEINKECLKVMEYLKQHVRDVYSREQTKLDNKESYYKSNNYIPPKNSIPVIYNGKEYKSKAQCCYCENISINTLNKYLNEK